MEPRRAVVTQLQHHQRQPAALPVQSGAGIRWPDTETELPDPGTFRSGPQDLVEQAAHGADEYWRRAVEFCEVVEEFQLPQIARRLAVRSPVRRVETREPEELRFEHPPDAVRLVCEEALQPRAQLVPDLKQRLP